MLNFESTSKGKSNYMSVSDGTEIDRKLNVAITRAKKRLIMIGNTEILKQSPVYARMLEYLEN